ncbi:MAG: alkaline phosphatase family protein, partial [Sedimentisphaerales bacterium]|nr:alkaline phosphatase family protein [Sedimentisphaerales bacterium]
MGKAATNPAWLEAKPIWTLAELHGLITATYYWPEADAKIDGVLPHYYFHYNKSTPYQQRVDQIIRWLKLPANQRPALITSYFSLVDTEGHHYGPTSTQVAKAVKTVDDYVGQLKQRIDKELPFPVDIIVVSDHGMTTIDPGKRILVGTLPN